MATINAPGRTVTIDGQQTTVRFTVNSLIAVEERFGGLEKVDEAMAANRLKAVRFLLWASTGRKSGIAEEDFGEMEITPNLAGCVRLITEAFVEAVGADEAAAVDPTTLETAATPGTSS